MKRFALLLVALAGLVAVGSGCATPAHTAQERHAQIARNWDYEGKQMTEDFDSFFLLRPASRMTIWNVR